MSVRHSAPTSWRRRSGTLILVAGFAVAASLAFTTHAASAAADCPTEGLPFSSELTNGTVKIGKMEPATGATATVCGVVTFTPELTLQATVPKANLTFEPLRVPLAVFKVPVEIKAVSDFTGPAFSDEKGMHIKLTGQVVATTEILGSTCTIGPFTTALTTDSSGSLTGAPFIGPDPSNLNGRLVGNEDAVPAAKLSLRCLIAPILNGIIGLPSPAGESSIDFDASLVLTPAVAHRLNAGAR